MGYIKLSSFSCQLTKYLVRKVIPNNQTPAMTNKCAICGKEATYKCQHNKTHAIRFYCEKHKPTLDEPCNELYKKI